MKILASAVLIVPFLAELLFAQPVSIGVLGGVPLIDQTQNNSLSHDESRPYILGPSVEVRLPAGFAIEVDAVYQRIGSTSRFALIDSPDVVLLGPVIAAQTTRTRANEWEFPVLGKYYFRRSSAWQPFVGTGWALRFANIHESGTESIVNAGPAVSTVSFNNSFRSDLEVGATFVAGIRYRIGHFALQPQFRYTRWGSPSFLRRDEAAFQLGLSF